MKITCAYKLGVTAVMAIMLGVSILVSMSTLPGILSLFKPDKGGNKPPGKVDTAPMFPTNIPTTVPSSIPTISPSLQPTVSISPTLSESVSAVEFTMKLSGVSTLTSDLELEIKSLIIESMRPLIITENDIILTLVSSTSRRVLQDSNPSSCEVNVELLNSRVSPTQTRNNVENGVAMGLYESRGIAVQVLIEDTNHPSSQPSMLPSSLPSSLPSTTLSDLPSWAPSSITSTQPSMLPSSLPTSIPSTQPSMLPSNMPSSLPTSMPSSQPSILPSNEPSSLPTSMPSSQPSMRPSNVPSDEPSMLPSTEPSDQPSQLPSKEPSRSPSNEPTDQPSLEPSSLPSQQPSSMPSSEPSLLPSNVPSLLPTNMPSMLPSNKPSQMPSSQPTCDVSDEINRLQEENEFQPTLRRRKLYVDWSLVNEYGCFYHDNGMGSGSFIEYELSSSILDFFIDPKERKVRECYKLCESNHFAITATKCFCYVDAPTQRISMEGCAEIKDTCLDHEKMADAYMKVIPTNQPSLSPSSEPSQEPSRDPSSEPSLLPSSLPSSMPSSQPSCDDDYEIQRLQEEFMPQTKVTEADKVTRQTNFSQQKYHSNLRLYSKSSLPFNDYGCFYHDREIGFGTYVNIEVPSSDKEELEWNCYNECDTKHFAITSTKCNCYFDPPTRRISMGTCASVTKKTCLDPEEMIDAYMKKETNDSCSNDNSRAVRDYFVQENNAPFSYDIISNTYRSSPFELSKDKCGTNIYGVKTAVSASASKLTTTSKSITEYAESSRSRISSSIVSSISGSAKLGIAKVSATLSASADREVNALLKSSGANSLGSRVYTSFIVKRVAEIKIQDFDNKMNFVTFNEEFGRLLKTYRENGYDISTAKQIFGEYGMFIVESGRFGGYSEVKATVNESDINSYGSSESDFKDCFEKSVQAEASVSENSVSASRDIAGCSEEAEENMKRLQKQYSEEVSTETVHGGSIDGDTLVVDADKSILLTNIDHYPEGEEGIQLRPITDFLASSKISPLEVRKHGITETQFDQIKDHLENHMIEVLTTLDAVLQKCKVESASCLVPFLTKDNNGNFSCSCYDFHPIDYICLSPEELNILFHKSKVAEFGGDLVKIECEEQNNIVQDLIDGYTYIGIFDILTSDINDPAQEFRYQDGSELKYENFESDEPNNKDNVESCVEMRDSGKWNDIWCMHKRRAVYQVPAPIPEYECIEYPLIPKPFQNNWFSIKRYPESSREEKYYGYRFYSIREKNDMAVLDKVRIDYKHLFFNYGGNSSAFVWSNTEHSESSLITTFKGYDLGQRHELREIQLAINDDSQGKFAIQGKDDHGRWNYLYQVTVNTTAVNGIPKSQREIWNEDGDMIGSYLGSSSWERWRLDLSKVPM